MRARDPCSGPRPAAHSRSPGVPDAFLWAGQGGEKAPPSAPSTEGGSRKRKAKEKLREVWLAAGGSCGLAPGRLETPRPLAAAPSFPGHLAAPRGHTQGPRPPRRWWLSAYLVPLQEMAEKVLFGAPLLGSPPPAEPPASPCSPCPPTAAFDSSSYPASPRGATAELTLHTEVRGGRNFKTPKKKAKTGEAEEKSLGRAAGGVGRGRGRGERGKLGAREEPGAGSRGQPRLHLEALESPGVRLLSPFG